MQKLKNTRKFMWFDNSLHPQEENDFTMTENKVIALQGGGDSVSTQLTSTLTISLYLSTHSTL